MRIGIDATAWTNPRGYGRYIRGLLGALAADPGAHRLIFFVDQGTRAADGTGLPENVDYVVVPTRHNPAEAASAESNRSMADMFAISNAMRKTPMDILFFPSVFTFVPCLTNARTLLGVHDVIAEDFPNLVFPERRRRWMWNIKGWIGRKQADTIVTVSEHARAGILRKFDWPAKRTWVVGEAPDPVFRSIDSESTIQSVLEKYGLDTDLSYMVALGGLNPHKNIRMLLEVLSELRSEEKFLDLHLVLVGPAESDSFTPGVGDLRSIIPELGLQNHVHITGYMPDEEVVCLLNGARALVMPSLAEGYGLGAVEAAACGIPVLATRNSPLPEILEGGGLFFNPIEPAELRAAITRLLENEDLRLEMGMIAKQRASLLTWPRAAAQFKSLIDTFDENV